MKLTIELETRRVGVQQKGLGLVLRCVRAYEQMNWSEMKRSSHLNVDAIKRIYQKTVTLSEREDGGLLQSDQRQ